MSKKQNKIKAGSVRVVTADEVDVMLAVSRMTFATSDLARDLRPQGRRSKKRPAKGISDKVLQRACEAMEGFCYGGPYEGPGNLEARIEDRVSGAMPWLISLFFSHLVSWSISFLVKWLFQDLTHVAEGLE